MSESCLLCGRECKSVKGLTSHIVQVHKITGQEYWDKFYERHGCRICNDPTNFVNVEVGYAECCCREHTNLYRYGSKNPLGSKQIRQKIAETNIIRYGASNPFAAKEIKEKIQATCINRYGVDVPSKSEIVKQKSKDTCTVKYGVPYSFQSNNNKEKAKATMQKRYKVSHNSQIPSIHKALVEKSHTLDVDRKRNLTLSKFHVFEVYLRSQLHIGVVSEYYSDEYPYCCDIYIPEYNLYIEINAFWTHSFHFYDNTSDEDRKQLDIWKEKAKTNRFYKNAVTTWTVKDINKRNMAIKNNLNYIVLWNKSHINEFIKQFNNGEVFKGFNDFNERNDIVNE